MDKKDLRSIEYPKLEDMILSLGEKKFRACQIYDWLHKKQAGSFDEMSNVPKSLKERLSEDCFLFPATVNRVQESSIDGTRKYLFELHDGNGDRVGVITDVDEQTENAIFIVDCDGGEVMVPASDDLILEFDLDKRVMVMDLPIGLLELNNNEQ